MILVPLFRMNLLQFLLSNLYWAVGSLINHTTLFLVTYHHVQYIQVNIFFSNLPSCSVYPS